MLLAFSIFLIVAGTLLGMDYPEHDWKFIAGLWMVVVGSACMIMS